LVTVGERKKKELSLRKAAFAQDYYKHSPWFVSRPLSRVPFRWLWPIFPYLCALRCAMGTLVDNGGCYFNGRSSCRRLVMMVMKDELAELRTFKATTTPAATTGAAHPGKRARVQQDRLPEIARFRGAAHCFCYFQVRGEGETVRELPVSNRAGQEIFINTMSVARSRASAKQEPSKSKCKSNEPSRVTSQAHQQVSARMHRAKVAQSCAAQKGANPPKRKVSEQSKDAACEQQNAPRKCSNEDVATKKQVRSRYAREDPFLSPQTHVARQASAC